MDIIIKKQQTDAKHNFCYNNKMYDISNVPTFLSQAEEVKAIKTIMEIIQIPALEAKLIVDVIKFNNNEIPVDYNECLEHMRAGNQRRVNANTVTCPYCHSSNVKKITNTSKVVHTAMFGLFSIGRNSKNYHCNNCKSDF